MERIEELDYCARCGGLCCLHAPGRFCPDDLAPSGCLDEKVVNDALDTGLAIIGTSFTNLEGSKTAPIFTLCARGIDREPLSLCHAPSCCAHLENDRCLFPLEKRPYECAVMVPASSISRCGLPDDAVVEPMWVEHQDLLRTVIENRSGRCWREELLRQIESRWRLDAYANGAWSLITSIGLANDSSEAETIVSAWLDSLN